MRGTGKSEEFAPPAPSKVWVQLLQAHLDLLNQNVRLLPAGERLEVDDLNKILQSTEEFRQGFLFMMELHGFTVNGGKASHD